MSKNIVAVTDDTFEQEVLQSQLPVLVDFWAPWCGPCRIVGPVVEELASEYAGQLKVAKLNTDENQETSVKYGIMSIPTLAVFHNGEVVDGVVGAAPKRMLKELLDKHAKKVPANQATQ
jgi:thioredoxin 1